MKEAFKDGLEERCHTGAANVGELTVSLIHYSWFLAQASAAAVDTSDAFASSMHWGSYRASKIHHTSLFELLLMSSSSSTTGYFPT
jgi:hypothetical protein